MRFALAARKGNSSESTGWWEFYRSNIAGLCKNNIQIKNQKKSEFMNPIKRISEKLYQEKLLNGNFGLF
jgi:hypothetical protein